MPISIWFLLIVGLSLSTISSFGHSSPPPLLPNSVSSQGPKKFFAFSESISITPTPLRESTGPPNVPVPFYRYFDQSTGDHFYTTDVNEINDAKQSYTFQKVVGKIYKAPRSGTVPLFLYYNSDTLHHYYKTRLGQLGGQDFQGISGYVFENAEDDTVPLYRFHDGTTGNNFYTTNLTESILLPGYKLETIEAYIYPINYVEFSVDLERLIGTEIFDTRWTLLETTLMVLVGHTLDNFWVNLTQEVGRQLENCRAIEVPKETTETDPASSHNKEIPSSSLLESTSCGCNGPFDGFCGKVFQHSDHAGASTCVHLRKSPDFSDCENLSEWWQDRDSPTARVSSTKIFDPLTCLRLYSEVDCGGEHVDIFGGSLAEKNLHLTNFDDRTRSVGLCTLEPPTTPTLIPSPFTKFKTERFGQANYTVVLEPTLSWESAKIACQNAGLVLAGVETLAIKNFLIKLLADAGVGYDYWGSMVYTGGLRSGDHLSWIENDSEPIRNFFWSSGEPNHLGGTENCMVIWMHQVGRGEAGGNDSLCDLQHPFICKTKN